MKRESGKQARQPASQPASQAASQPASQPATQPASQPGSQPAGQPASQPAPLSSGALLVRYWCVTGALPGALLRLVRGFLENHSLAHNCKSIIQKS